MARTKQERQSIAGRIIELRPKDKVKKASKIAIALRLARMVFSFYPLPITAVAICILLSSILSALPTIFIQQALALISSVEDTGNWEHIASRIIWLTGALAMVHLASLILITTWRQLMAIIGEGSLKKLRVHMFKHMQKLPLSYFDKHLHGDIMSHYTNDIDAVWQMISQSLPQVLVTSIVLTADLCIMLWYSVWMALVVVTGAALLVALTRYFGSRSAQHFLSQQRVLGKIEGFAEETMAGEKVIKVFCHERESIEAFDEINEGLYREARSACTYANVIAPILINMGNVVYVLVAIIGGLLLTFHVPNISISGTALTLAVAIPFLNITRQFCSQIGETSQQITPIIMGIAGAERIFELLDEDPEHDAGYVTLVNARIHNGMLQECHESTGLWAWKHPHKDGTTTYTKLTGAIEIIDVDFGYTPGHTVLHDISIYATPGQKIALVGATGAGKTTITNLLNRFYDLTSGKIRYDGINITKIKKADLRRSLGMVLQDTNVFYGTVIDNIRYGRLDATDQECIAAAELVGADSFITRLSKGYHTLLTDNGSQLSQGQRQLLSIARAAVADTPVMILDEATSSIDTHTEEIVQKGMDALMQGRTTFVIAHRLSTVRNSDHIVVLDHGRIIERGTHEELLARGGVYYQLYTGAFELE